MLYVCVTQVDAATRIPCTEAAMSTGPAYPILPNMWVHFWDESNYPIETDNTGRYLTAPIFWATCDETDEDGNPANLTQSGVLSTITEEEFNTARYNEAYARKPYESWTFNAEDLSWRSPTPHPDDGKQYIWDEPTVSWVEIEMMQDPSIIEGETVVEQPAIGTV